MHEQIRYCAARFAWRHRNEYCENVHEFPDGRSARITWAEWFEIEFGLSLDEFQRQHQHLKESRP